MYRNRHQEKAQHDLNELKEIIHELRDPEYGCDWDVAQTHETLKKNLRDECEEVCEAIDNNDDNNLCEELGDVLMQVLMHAEIAEERGAFRFEDVVQGVSEKLIRRHPHVFGDLPKPETKEEIIELWKEIKKREKSLNTDGGS